MRGALGDIADQTYSSVHKMILEFLQLTLEGKNFPIDRRYMPFINLSLTTDEPGLVLHQPAMDKVIVEEGKKFWSGNDTTLVFDAYYPPGFDKKQTVACCRFREWCWKPGSLSLEDLQRLGSTRCSERNDRYQLPDAKKSSTCRYRTTS